MFEIVQTKGKSIRRVVRKSPPRVGEIGRAYRYRVPLCAQAELVEGRSVSDFAFFPTKDISTTGFYFVSDALLPEQARINFVISYPRGRSCQMVELMRGTGRCVRVEQLPCGDVVRYGIGVHIEKSTSADEMLSTDRKHRSHKAIPGGRQL
jgi:hypothetical protein